MASERALGRVQKRVLGAMDVARSLSNRILIAAKDREESVAVPLTTAQSIQDRQHELLTFYERYEELVETLCGAAQFGPSAESEARYQRLRGWVEANYPPVRRYVVAFLRYSAEDAEQGIALWGKSADAFEALVAAESLDEFLRADDGTMISRINRTRDALSLYGEHLRKLAATI